VRPYREAASEGTQVGCFSIPIILLLIVAMIGATAAYYTVAPYFMHQEAQIQRASPQYVEAKRTLLIKLQQDYEQPTATDGQRVAIIKRMKEERSLLPPEDVPAGVSSFIAQHGG
jgi:hypothetical protein